MDSITIPEKLRKSWIFSSTLKAPKKSRTNQGIQRLGTLKTYVWNSMHLPVIFHPPNEGCLHLF